MINYTDRFLYDVITEIQGPDEVNRRALAKKRHDIYKDGGKAFLIEQLTREFSEAAIAEMRITPINFLKKVVNALGSVYKRPPQRHADDAKDQALVDFYVQDLSINSLMQKANRYLVLASNTVIYSRPWMKKDGSWCLRSEVTPNYLYSIVPNPMDLTDIHTIIFSAFVDGGRVTPRSSIRPATGVQGYSQEQGYKTDQDVVASNERDTALNAEQYIFWSDQEHVTTNGNGAKFARPGEGEEQFLNPIERLPIVNIARDRDNEPWATQGEDMVDLTIALQLGWSDVMTIAKHQGFSLLTLMSEEEPKKLTIGLNRALWMRLNPNSPPPSVEFVSANSPLAQYTEMLDKLTKLFLTTNNMDPGSIGGDAKSANFTSGFHALISMSDSLEAVESDKPIMSKAEVDLWDVIARWHNWMFDNDLLSDEAKALGKFSEEFEIHLMFQEVKPLESEDEKINRIKELNNLGLITKRQSLQRLHPDASDEQIDAIMEEIATERDEALKKAQEQLGEVGDVPDTTDTNMNSVSSGSEDPEDEEDEEEEDGE